EEAVVAYFRAQGLGPSQLLANCGLSLEIVDIRLRLKEGMRVDDEIEALLALTAAAEGGRIVFTVQLLKCGAREGEKSVVAPGRAAGFLRKLHENFGADMGVPAALKGAVHGSLEAAAGSHEAPVLIPTELAGTDVGRVLQRPDKSSIVWKRRI